MQSSKSFYLDYLITAAQLIRSKHSDILVSVQRGIESTLTVFNLNLLFLIWVHLAKTDDILSTINSWECYPSNHQKLINIDPTCPVCQLKGLDPDKNSRKIYSWYLKIVSNVIKTNHTLRAKIVFLIWPMDRIFSIYFRLSLFTQWLWLDSNSWPLDWDEPAATWPPSRS